MSVETDGLPIAVHGQRMLCALSVLLVNLNERVRADVLIESVWGPHPSPRAPAALDTLMWRLRRVIDPGRSARASSTVLRTEEQAYRLTLPPEVIDSWRFSAAAQIITDYANPPNPATVLEVSESTLGLWRGRPYDDVADHGWLEPHRSRLTEQHLAVQQARIGALLSLGRPEQAVTELVPILAEHQFDERLWGYRILGLYQSSRVNAALEAYTQARTLLDRELGMRPGPELRSLHERILRHDPTLSAPSPAPALLARGAVRIPRHRTPLVGREEEIGAVAELVRVHRLVSVIGPVGCGKTRVATAVAEHLQARYADGVCFVDLSDVTSDSGVADRVQATLGIEGEPAATAAQAVGAFLSGRELLLVLDNCEQVSHAAAGLVAEILAHDGPLRVLVTSRRMLEYQGETVYRLRPLEPPASAVLADLESSPAVSLFVERAASHGIAIDLSGPGGAEVARICQAIDGLPLAIELAAARARVFELHEIAASVSDSPTSLGSTSRTRGGALTLGQSIGWSHSLLSEPELIAHRRLSVLPPRFTLEAAVAVCADDQLPPELVPNALVGLASQSLLEATQPERPGGPSLFRQLVPIRAHAAQQLAVGEADAAAQALLAWIGAMLEAGPRMGRSDGGALDRKLEDNRQTITTALETAIAAGPSDDVIVTLCRLVPYWWLEGQLSPETVRLVSAAAASVGPANSEFAAGAAIAAHGSFLVATNQPPLRDDVLRQAIGRLAESPPQWATFAAELLLAVAAACWVGGDMRAADAAADAVAAYGQRLDDDQVGVLAKAIRCALGLVTDPVAAGEAARAVLLESRALGNTSAMIMTLHTLYMSALFAGNGLEGLEWNAEAIRIQQETGQRNAATTLEARGSLYVLAGNPSDAIRCYASAHVQHARVGRSWPQIPGTELLLSQAREQLATEEFDEAWASGERLGASELLGAWM